MGDDILLGGAGYDTYNVGDGDYIRGIDARMGVYLGGKLTGSRWNEEEKTYVGKRGKRDRLNGNKLTIMTSSGEITIDKFKK